jgi:hypothetical protein
MTTEEFNKLCEAKSFEAVARGGFPLAPSPMLKALVEAAVSKESLKLNERIKRLEESLESIREYWNGDNNNRAMIDACWYAIDTAAEALEAKEAKP